MLSSLAMVDAIESRLGQSIADVDLPRAIAALEDASALVRQETGRDWVDEFGHPNAPGPVVAVVLTVALRVLRNPEGLISESIGPFSKRRADGETGLYLTDQEKAVCRRFRPAARGLWTQPVTRGEEYNSTIWVNDQFGTEPFPIGTAGELW